MKIPTSKYFTCALLCFKYTAVENARIRRYIQWFGFFIKISSIVWYSLIMILKSSIRRKLSFSSISTEIVFRNCLTLVYSWYTLMLDVYTCVEGISLCGWGFFVHRYFCISTARTVYVKIHSTKSQSIKLRWHYVMKLCDNEYWKRLSLLLPLLPVVTFCNALTKHNLR